MRGSIRALAATPGACGVILHSPLTAPSNYRNKLNLDAWLKRRGGICIDPEGFHCREF